MYNAKTKGNSGDDIFGYIKGTDIFNSRFLYELDNIEYVTMHQNFEIVNRLDLVSNRYYNDFTGMGVIAVFNRVYPGYRTPDNIMLRPTESNNGFTFIAPLLEIPAEQNVKAAEMVSSK